MGKEMLEGKGSPVRTGRTLMGLRTGIVLAGTAIGALMGLAPGSEASQKQADAKKGQGAPAATKDAEKKGVRNAERDPDPLYFERTSSGSLEPIEKAEMSAYTRQFGDRLVLTTKSGGKVIIVENLDTLRSSAAATPLKPAPLERPSGEATRSVRERIDGLETRVGYVEEGLTEVREGIAQLREGLGKVEESLTDIEKKVTATHDRDRQTDALVKSLRDDMLRWQREIDPLRELAKRDQGPVLRPGKEDMTDRYVGGMGTNVTFAFCDHPARITKEGVFQIQCIDDKRRLSWVDAHIFGDELYLRSQPDRYHYLKRVPLHLKRR